jgi:putative ABC transport system permease protein
MSQLYLRELGSDNIIVSSVKPPSDESQASGGEEGWVFSYGLTRADARQLRENLPGLRRSVSVHRTRKTAYARGRKVSVDVLGTSPELLEVARTPMVAGRFITSADMLRRKAFCVVPATFARKMFGYDDPLGRIVTLNGEPFEVVGIMAKVPEVLAGRAGDNVLIIPLATDRSRFGELTIMFEKGSRTSERVEVSQLILQMDSEQAVIDGSAIARSLLERQRDKDDWEIKVPLELLEQQKKQQRLWGIVFVVIAAVSLVVGGIGIMNIMLASVTERTREIGVRRALGAKKRDITLQFLVEAIALTTVGGALGIAVGLAVPWIIENSLGFKTIVSAKTLLLPFLTAVGSGLVSGLYPAMRAAKLDPIVALRHE